MNFIFIAKGRLGNAIFRYMGCLVMCIKYNGKYSTIINNINYRINDKIFLDLISNENSKIADGNYLMTDYYQHDTIYKNYKKLIIDFINENNHIVVTDGIKAGDGNKQIFNMKDIITTPKNFDKIYDIVFHIRLGDKVNSNHTISLERILNLINNFKDISYSKICILCDECKSDYEENFINSVKNRLNLKFKKNVIFESNDILTDFYIMSNCKILVCSVSTLSWVAAFFSKTIEKCYMPNHNTKITNEFCTCYYPIDNTELYHI
tara:strand:+ start:999 stop:1790 length:792 start_codon:yes stop_codon:yes gene_type:complete